MRLVGIFLIAFFYSWNFQAQSIIQPHQVSPRSFSETEILEDINVLRDILNEAHPSLYLYNSKSEIERHFKDFYKNIPSQPDEREFYKHALELISKIYCGHTWLNASKQLSDSLWQNIDDFPLEVKIVEDRLIYAGKNKGQSINKGNEIIEINGRPTKELIQSFLKYTVGDGFIETGRIRMVERRFGFYFALLHGFHSTYEIKYLNDSQQVSKVTITKGSTPKITTADRATGNANIQLTSLGSTTAKLQISSFSGWSSGNRHFDFKAALKDAFQEIRTSQFENLVIDLRDNRGGADAYGLELLSYLIPNSIRPFKKMYSKTINSPLLRTYSNLDEEVYLGLPEITTRMDDTAYVYCQQMWMKLSESNLPESTATISCDDPFPLSQPQFIGKIYVLINGNTFSTASDVSAILFSQGLATFFGEETGGGYYGNTSGITPIITLPNSGFELRLPLIRYETNIRKIFPEGRGVIPHYPFPETVQNIITEDDEMLSYLIKTVQEQK